MSGWVGFQQYHYIVEWTVHHEWVGRLPAISLDIGSEMECNFCMDCEVYHSDQTLRAH